MTLYVCLVCAIPVARSDLHTCPGCAPVVGILYRWIVGPDRPDDFWRLEAVAAAAFPGDFGSLIERLQAVARGAA